MTVKINGEEKAIESGITIAVLLDSLSIEGPVAVEWNGDLLEAADFADAKLSENDTLEIVRFVGGG